MKNWQNHIEVDSDILLGKPIIKETRISIEFILERLADGWTREQILENHPSVKSDDIVAIHAYTHECFRDGLLFLKMN